MLEFRNPLSSRKVVETSQRPRRHYFWIGDDPASVAENWRRWHTDFPGLRPVLLNQVHGNKVLRIRAGDPILDGERPAADGIVTSEPGTALCIFSADCVPVLLYDDAAGIVAALHAGWRGTLAGVASEGIRAMIDAGARARRSTQLASLSMRRHGLHAQCTAMDAMRREAVEDVKGLGLRRTLKSSEF